MNYLSLPIFLIVLFGTAGCQSPKPSLHKAEEFVTLPSHPSDFEIFSIKVFRNPNEARRARHAMLQSREIESSLSAIRMMASKSSSCEDAPHLSRELWDQFNDLTTDLIGFRLRYSLEVMNGSRKKHILLDPNVFEEDLEVLRLRRDRLWELFVEENDIEGSYKTIYPIEPTQP